MAIHFWYNKRMVWILAFLALPGICGGAVLFQDSFASNSISAYDVVTRGTLAGPAQWAVTNGTLQQTSNVYDQLSTELWLGTTAVFGDSGWDDFCLSLDLMATDNDGIGFLFRWRDSANYYQFHWDRDRALCRIEKIIAGATSVEVLAALNTVVYQSNVWYRVELTAIGKRFFVSISGNGILDTARFSATDTAFKSGKLGLYAWGCEGAYFDNVLVTDSIPDTSLVTVPLTGWFKGQLHCHTANSDGMKTPDSAAAMYRRAGYDFLAISDHNRLTPSAHLAATGFLTIPNVEINSGRNHVNVIGLTGAVPNASSVTTLGEVVNLAVITGALPQINHPDWSNHTAATVLAAPGAPLMEVMQTFDDLRYDEGVWDGVLSAGRLIYGTGTDDAHTYIDDFNKQWVMVRADTLTETALLDALKAGDFYASNGAVISSVQRQGGRLSVETPVISDISFIGKFGAVLSRVNATHAEYALQPGDLYVRAKVADNWGRIALTQPLFAAAGAVSITGRAETCAPVLLATPNPFSRSVTLTWPSLESGVRPVIQIFTLDGRKIHSSEGSSADRGYYWDASGRAPGIYLAKLQAGRASMVTPLQLVK